MMRFKQLEYFIAAAEELNFTKAAEKKYVSQTAITQQVKVLEEEMEVRLFDRTNKYVKLTAAGEVFFEEAKRLLRQYEQAVVRAQVVSNGFSGDLQIGISTGLYNTNAPEVFRNFHDSYPGIHLEFNEAEPFDMLNDLKGGKYDYIMTPRFKQHLCEGLVIDMLDQYPVICAVHERNALSNKEEIQWKDLAGCHLIVTMAERDELEDFSNVLADVPSTAAPHNIKFSENIESIMFALGCNMGIGLMPGYFRGWLHREKRITALPFENNQINIDICGVWNPQNKNPALLNFVNFMETDVYRKKNRAENDFAVV